MYYCTKNQPVLLYQSHEFLTTALMTQRLKPLQYLHCCLNLTFSFIWQSSIHILWFILLGTIFPLTTSSRLTHVVKASNGITVRIEKKSVKVMQFFFLLKLQLLPVTSLQVRQVDRQIVKDFTGQKDIAAARIQNHSDIP